MTLILDYSVPNDVYLGPEGDASLSLIALSSYQSLPPPPLSIVLAIASLPGRVTKCAHLPFTKRCRHANLARDGTRAAPGSAVSASLPKG